jgi:hypothetical protein
MAVMRRRHIMSRRFAWGHININVRDLDASVGFCRMPGFEPMLPGVPYVNLNSETPSSIAAEAAVALGVREEPRGRACIVQLDYGFPKLDLTEPAVAVPRCIV